MRIISYRDLAPGRFAKSVEKIRAALARGDFAAAGLKKLSPTPYWRAKLNDEARLLIQFAPYLGEMVCLFLEVIPNHAYEKSRFLRGAAIDPSKIESGPDDDAAPQPEPTARGLELRWLPAQAAEFELLDRPIVFDDAQEAVRRHKVPLVVVGSAGSGKTAVTLAKMREATGRVLYVTLSAYLAQTADTPPKAAVSYLQKFQQDAADLDDVRIATLCGRYYAMDRDKRWDRVEKAYRMLVEGVGERAEDPVRGVGAAYDRGETDEFVQPTVIGGYAGMRDGDGVLIGNFRADRVREIAAALLKPDFVGFARNKRVSFAAALGLVEYSTELNRLLDTLFPPEDLTGTFGEVVSRAGLTQLRIAETEKYAHVTFFFNGGRETVFPGEERILVPSPRVATYDKQPEMSAPEVTDKVVEAVAAHRFDIIVLNYANTDMVGHTGRLDAAIEAVETVDACLGRLSQAVEHAGGTLVITADHGNAEMMRDPKTGEPHTAHTLDPVPFVVVNPPATTAIGHLDDGRLCDVAPTLLDLLGLPRPAAMTGHSLIAAPLEQEAAG